MSHAALQSYDATVEFETSCDDILNVFKLVTGEPLDLEKYSKATLESAAAAAAEGGQ